MKRAIRNANRNWCVGADGAYLITHSRGISPGCDLFAEFAFYLISVSQHVFQCAVFFQQLHCCLLANARYAGNIIGVVAHQAFQVTHTIGLQSVLLFEYVPVKFDGFADSLLGHEHMCALADELQRVAIPRNEQRIYSFRLTFSCECAKDIVCFIARCLADRDAHLLQQFF